MKNKYFFTAALLVLLTIFSAVIVQFSTVEDQEEGEKLAAASFYPIYIAAWNVSDGVEGVRLECLTQPSAGCAHDHQLTAKDMKQLERADLFLINGAGMESYLEDVEERYPQLLTVECCKGTALLEAEDHQHEEEDGHEELYNAHVWMDMKAYCLQIDNIAEAFIQIDPEHKEEYRANAKAYKDKIHKLEEEAEELGMVSNSRAVSTHEAFSYFAQNIQWDIAETVNMDENTELKASQVSEVIRAAKDTGISYVFTEEAYGTSLGNILKKEAGCRIVALDPLVSGEIDKDAYLKGMRQNIKMLKEAVEDEETGKTLRPALH